MKRNIIKWLGALGMILFIIPWQGASAQTDYNVPVTLSVSNTAIDRFIGTQWASIKHSWTGFFQYGPYNVTLKEPTVILSDNSIEVVLGITYTTGGPSGSFTITPSLTIPPATVTAGNIITDYQDLQQQIDSKVTDQYVRSLIYGLLSPITWIIYQGQILDNSTTRLTQTADISLKGLPSLTFAVQNNAVDITVTPVFEAVAPSYSFYWVRPTLTQFGLKVTSNDQFVIENLDIYISGGGSQIDEVPLTQPGRVTATWNSTDGLYEATYYVNATSALSTTLYSPTYSIKLMRQYSETLWCELCAPFIGYDITTFNPFNAQSNNGTTISE